MNIKNFSKKALISFGLGGAFIAGSIVFAAATIPAACSTPGTCTDIESTFQAVVSKTSMKFLDNDASNSISIQAPADVTADVSLTLPATAGNNGEVLSTDGNGALSWKVSVDDRFLGMIAFMVSNSAQHIWEINGQTVTDPKLAAYITANPIDGFTVNGDDVELPNWRGRYLGATGARGISSTAGSTLASTNKSHTHKFRSASDDDLGGSGYVTEGQNAGGWHTTTSSGSSYARPETAAMPIVIIGGSI